MDTIRKALAVALKDLRVFSTDRAYLLSMLLVPLAIGLFSAATFGGEGGIRLPVAVVNRDAGVYGASIAKVLADIEQIDLTELDSSAAAESRVAAGEALAAVIIPLDFTRRIDDYQPVQVTVVLDPAQARYGRILSTIMDEVAGALAIQGEIRYGIRTVLADIGLDAVKNPEAARAAQAQVEGVMFSQLQRMQANPPIDVHRETLQGQQVFTWDNAFSLMLPAFTVMFAFFIVPALSTELLKEKEAGALRRLVASPLPRGALLGGKVLAFLVAVVLQVAVIFGVGAILMDMSLGSSPAALILVTLALGLSATTLGMLVAALSRSVEQAGSIGLLLIFVLGFLGGALDPINAVYRGEGVLATISRLTPQAQAQIAYYTVMLQDGGVADVWQPLAYMLGLSLVFFLVAVWRFRFER